MSRIPNTVMTNVNTWASVLRLRVCSCRVLAMCLSTLPAVPSGVAGLAASVARVAESVADGRDASEDVEMQESYMYANECTIYAYTLTHIDRKRESERE